MTPAAFARAEATIKAAEIWAAMDKNEKAGVRFGLFPTVRMRAAETEGFKGHDICCTLMDCAKKDGGMRA